MMNNDEVYGVKFLVMKMRGTAFKYAVPRIPAGRTDGVTVPK